MTPSESSPASPDRNELAARLKRILLVEDHESTRNVLQRFLRHKGYEVTTAGGVEEARRLFVTFAPEILISDLGLPDGSGWDLLKELRSISPVRSIAISGFATMGDQARSKEAGYEFHISKPFSPEELEAVLDQVSRL